HYVFRRFQGVVQKPESTQASWVGNDHVFWLFRQSAKVLPTHDLSVGFLADGSIVIRQADLAVMSNSQPSTQSAAERRSAEAEVQTLVAKFAPANLRLVGAVRRCLRKRLPTAHELAYEYRDWFVISYSPNEHGYEGVLAIRGSADGVKLYFNSGKELPDPEKLLQGSGKQTRWMHLESASALARPEVASLIDEAIALSRAPFASAGRGPVVIRSGSVK
ncbi:MAG: hypothetical protein JWM11_5228, partial [Planctomycetaceae bacterium]|nr:hypothetical protein [Planctomycetaceae bacterium]